MLIATGSEVDIACRAAAALNADGAALRVVSMPCVEVFLRQDAAWQEAVLPAGLRRRIALEAGTSTSWYRFVGLDGLVIGIDSFGASAPAADLASHFALDADTVTSRVRRYLEESA